MRLKYYAYNLELTSTFTISHSSRKCTPAVLVELEHDGVTGFGEASLPPYLGETVESVQTFLASLDMGSFDDPFLVEDILHNIDKKSKGNHAAKAAIDIAIHDLIGKCWGLPWYKIWGLNKKNIPDTSFTIGIDTVEKVREKALLASRYKILKIKLGQANDKELVSAVREVSSVPIRVDVNEGWRDKYQALDMIGWLTEQNVELIEQPLPKDLIDDIAWLREKSPIPILADESVQRIDDIKKIAGVYDGINIKLMKCTGMREAYKMILLARAMGLKVMLGCMTETSCAISAAAQLSPLVDWIDLDGPLLISNDPFTGAFFSNGKMIPSDRPGIGCVKLL